MARSNFVLMAVASGLVLVAGGVAGCSSASSSNSGAGGSGAGSGATGNGGKLNIGGSNQGGAGGGGTPILCQSGKPAPDFADIPGNGKDDDCDGTVDNAPVNCDSAITQVEDNDPMNGARAIGLCQVSDGTSWGVIKAKYVRADGTPLSSTIGHGLLDNFGPAVNVQEGKRLLAISSGTARRPTDLGFASPNNAMHLDMNGLPEESAMPPGFPYDPPACPGASACDPNDPFSSCTANDPTALELTIKAPANAKSFKFKFNFYTYEFPIYICSPYNDFFVVLQDPAPSNAVKANISFDKQNNPVSVNNGFLEVCVAQMAGGKNFACALGPQQLTGTGFDEPAEDGPHAATGWLETKSPVEPGSTFTLRFAVWDVGDHILDSTVLIDAFEFSLDESTGSITTPVPTPK